ncbi:MAG: hypothetical protein AAF357_00330 [Verrucomicrobiota bacterium]
MTDEEERDERARRKEARRKETAAIYHIVYHGRHYVLPKWIVEPGQGDFIMELEDIFDRIHSLKGRMRSEFEKRRYAGSGYTNLDANLLNLLSRALSALRSWHDKAPTRAAPYVALWPKIDPFSNFHKAVP